MLIPSLPADEERRLHALYALAVLDTDSEPLFDDIVKLSSFIMGCPISLISLVDIDRQWFKARVGIDTAETPRDISFCAHAIHEDETFIVEDASKDERFADNPLVANDPSIRFYAGHPITTSEGFRIGTLCAIDRVSKTLTTEQLDMLQCLARQVSSLLERRRDQLKLDMTRTNSQSLFEKIPATIIAVKGPDHIFEYISSSKSRLFGGESSVGKALLEVKPEARASGLLDVLNQVYRDGHTQALRGSTFQVNGETRYYDLVFTPSHGLDGAIDGVMGIVDDITVRKRMEFSIQRLSDERDAKLEKMAELLEQVPIGIALLQEENHRFVFANQLYREYFVEVPSLTGKTVDEVVSSAHKDKILTILDEVLSTGQSQTGQEKALERRLPNGEQEQIICNFTFAAAKSADGCTTGVLAAVSDVTEQVRSRDEISAKVDALHAEREIREKFVATLTHDLRTPLTAAKMNAQLLKRKAEDPAAVKAMATRIINSIDRGENMVRDLLDANRLSAGEGLPLTLAQCSLDQILQDALSDFRTVRGREFTVPRNADSIRANWDRAAVRRVIENLVNNAVKYGSSDTDITVEAKPLAQAVELSVHNQGPSIPQEEQAALFQSYSRASSAIGSGHKGWGIGLTLVKGIAEAHGGSVRVESQPEQGTTFFVTLPLDSQAAS